MTSVLTLFRHVAGLTNMCLQKTRLTFPTHCNASDVSVNSFPPRYRFHKHVPAGESSQDSPVHLTAMLLTSVLTLYCHFCRLHKLHSPKDRFFRLTVMLAVSVLTLYRHVCRLHKIFWPMDLHFCLTVMLAASVLTLCRHVCRLHKMCSP